MRLSRFSRTILKKRLLLNLLQIWLMSTAKFSSQALGLRGHGQPWDHRSPSSAPRNNIAPNPSELLPPMASVTASPTVISVNQNGHGDYRTLQEAIDAVPTHNTQRVIIKVYSGTYREKVHIKSSKPFISLVGDGSTPPIISWNDTAASSGSTWDSSTIAIDASNFIATRMIFENTAPSPPPGSVGGQAIALRIGGDMAAFYGCQFLGAQDTLCDWQGRHYFKDCTIRGSIDFIFGNGQSLYEGCSIKSIATSSGSITAQYRQSASDSSGYSFVNCSVAGSGSIYLGRAWGAYSRVVFASTSMADMIDPVGWNDWNMPSSDGTVYYGEFQNSGPGANRAQRVAYSRTLTQEEATPFLTIGWIDGQDWLDQS